MPGITPNFRQTIAGTDDLDRKTTQLEDNTNDALNNIAMQAWRALFPTNLKIAAYTANLDELIPCSGTFTITLPVATPKNVGRGIGLEVKAGTITVVAQSGLVQGVAVDTCPAIGDFVYISDGVGWYRPGGVTSVTAGTGLTTGGVTTGAVTISADTTTLLTATALNTAVRDVRFEVERMRVLVMQLAKAMMGAPIDTGVEGLQ